VAPTSVQGEVIAVLPATPLLTPLILGQALPKHAKMDLIIEKCSELGLTTLVPLYTARTVVRAVADRLGEKRERWQRIAVAAAQQCRRQTVLDIQPPQFFTDFCAGYAPAPVKIFCWEEEQQQGLHQVLTSRKGLSPVVVLVGPEGGFTAHEAALARAHGFQAVSLGPLTLRTETAAIVITTIVRYSLHELEPQKECS
jgi:16S rRNA (uracil1498-N3)-methyltransferase